MALVKIHYCRPPARITVYENELLHADEDVTITVVRATQLEKPARVDGDVILENGSPVIWFTFPFADHDIGRFHTHDGAFTGLYANILTPVEFISPTEWRSTDLFLDVWIGNDGNARILDEDELDEALQLGWVDEQTADAARATARRLVQQHRDGTWPPPVVYDWPLERLRGMES
jgi:predicted RNA-binding protein associated with RNAse of E/G family